jgi:hypothetical protein
LRVIAAPSRRRAAWLRRFADGRAAVVAGDDVFSADDFAKATMRSATSFRMFDEVGGVHKLRVRSCHATNKVGSAGPDFHFSIIFAERPIRSFIEECCSIRASGHAFA